MRYLCAIIMAGLLPAGSAAQAETLTLPVGPLAIVSEDGCKHHLQVELASRREERTVGLSGRRELAADAGMLFDFGRDQPVFMWMADTYLSLDMLFIRSDGVIMRIEHETVPLSREIIPSRVNVRAVLEIGGGLAAKLGIVPGDRVLHPLFGSAP